MDLALLVIRLAVGLLFVGHGAQKLFGVFGGGGLEATAGMFDSIGLRPGWLHARAAGTAELLGSAPATGRWTAPSASICTARSGRSALWSSASSGGSGRFSTAGSLLDTSLTRLRKIIGS